VTVIGQARVVGWSGGLGVRIALIIMALEWIQADLSEK
jgi:hypothetical protein